MRLKYLLIGLFVAGFFHFSSGQVSLPERNPLKITVRGGVIANNPDMAAHLKGRIDKLPEFNINTKWTSVGEVELAADLFRFNGAGIGLQISGLYAQPEIRGTSRTIDERLGWMSMQMLKVNLTVSFNGSDPYTMFALPYHSNKEAVLGISAMVTRCDMIRLISYATDTLGITNTETMLSRSVGLLFGWNWRLGQSGWVFGLSGNLMFKIPQNELLKFTTSDQSKYESGAMGFTARMATIGFGYHF